MTNHYYHIIMGTLIFFQEILKKWKLFFEYHPVINQLLRCYSWWNWATTLTKNLHRCHIIYIRCILYNKSILLMCKKCGSKTKKLTQNLLFLGISRKNDQCTHDDVIVVIGHLDKLDIWYLSHFNDNQTEME